MRHPMLAAVLLAAAGTVSAGEVQWTKNYDEALASAKQSGKLVHLHFYADW